MSFLYSLDANILLWIQEYIRKDWATPFWRFVSWLGDGGWFWISLSVLLLFFAKTRRVGITALLALLIGALCTNLLLKNLIARVRPYEVIDGLYPLVKKLKDFSFPSGHSCASFAASLVFFKKLPRRYGIASLVLASLIAISRLYLGVHYPSDVLGGIAIGLLSGAAALRIQRAVAERPCS